LDKDSKPVPGAAESWKFNDKGDEITFTLRDGLKYSDGSPLTSKNFLYAVQRTCDPVTAGEYQSILFDIVGCGDWASTLVTDTAAYDKGKAALGVTAPDDKTITFKLTQPAPYFPYLAYLWVMYPAKQELIEAGGEDWWKDPKNQIGNGPFKITDIQEDQLVTFEANDNYWDGRPTLDGIEYVYQKDSAVALEAYRAGQLDMMQPDPSQLPVIKGDAELSKELLEFPGAQTTQIQFNLAKEPFNDENVRKAFAYAFDRKTYCEQIRNGDCLPTLTWIPPGLPGSIETTDYGFDPAKAKEALAASKYKDAAALPEIAFTYSSDDPAAQPRVEWIAGQLRDILGISVKLDPLEAKAITALKKDPATYPLMSLGGWIQDYPDPQNWLSVYWLSSATFAKRVSYKNEQFDALVKQGDVELDPAKRLKFYVDAHKILIDTQAGVNLYNPAQVYLVKPSVKGLETNPSDSEWPGQWQPQVIDIQ
jgi:oligopeptide transport system substrate-binding protein